MPTLHLSDSLLDDYVALFAQMGLRDQAILLNRLRELMRENAAASEKQNGNENRADAKQRQAL